MVSHSGAKEVQPWAKEDHLELGGNPVAKEVHPCAEEDHLELGVSWNPVGSSLCRGGSNGTCRSSGAAVGQLKFWVEVSGVPFIVFYAGNGNCHVILIVNTKNKTIVHCFKLSKNLWLPGKK
jgi:hypothetical protein